MGVNHRVPYQGLPLQAVSPATPRREGKADCTRGAEPVASDREHLAAGTLRGSRLCGAGLTALLLVPAPGRALAVVFAPLSARYATPRARNRGRQGEQ